MLRKQTFGNGVGDVSLGHPSEMLFACSSPLPSLFCLSCKQANSLLGGIELLCLGFLLISCLDTGVALKERLVKTNHHLFFGEKKHEKKEKKSGLLSLCPSKLPKVLLWGEGTSRVLSFCSCLASKLSGPWGYGGWGAMWVDTKSGWAPPRNDRCSQRVGLLMVAIWAGRRGASSFSMKRGGSNESEVNWWNHTVYGEQDTLFTFKMLAAYWKGRVILHGTVIVIIINTISFFLCMYHGPGPVISPLHM